MAGTGAATDRAMAPGHHAVFIDTNLDTHLAMIVSDSDTVSDLKVKITLEHPVCFPQVGKIKVDAVKVKRRGHSYHLCDSMLVKNALGGLKKNWFLSVDISKQIEHPESGVLGTLLALTDKPSTDIVVGIADNQKKNSSDLVISATLQSPSKVSRGLEPMIARNHEIRPEIKTSQHASAASTLGEYSEGMNATSAVLSAGKTDDLGTNLNAKKIRKRNRASSSVDEPPQKKQILEHMHENSVHVDNRENGIEAYKVAEPLKQAEVEMDDVDAAKENQIAAEVDDVNGIVSVVVSEANNNEGKGNSISAVQNSADINHHVSEVSESHRNDGPEAPIDLLAEQHINASQDKIASDQGEGKDACKSPDAEKIMEEKFSPKKRKKLGKRKSTSENPKILLAGHSLVENPEVPLVEHSLVETLKPPHGDASDKPVNKKHNISPPQVEGIDVAAEEANVTSHEKQGNEIESSQQITKEAVATADNFEEKKKKKNKNRKKRGTEEKKVQASREMTDEGEDNVPNATEKEREVTASINKPDEHRSEAMSLELREEGAVNADNGEKEKPKRRTKKRKEKNVEQADGGPKKGEKNSSQVVGNQLVTDAFEKKSNEENVDESKEQHQEAVDDVKEKADKRGRKRRSDDIASQSNDNVEKDEISHSQTEGKETLEIAGAEDDKSRQEQVNQIEPVHEAAEIKAAPDAVQRVDKKSRKKRSSQEKSSGQSMHVPEKEEVNPSHVEVEERVVMDDGKVSSLEQRVAEKQNNAGEHEEKVEKKSKHRKSSKKKNLGSQEMVGLNSNHNETMPMEKEVEKNVEKMEKARKRRSKEKNVSSQEVEGTHDSSHKENLPTEEGSGDPVQEKIEKKSRNSKSSKVKNVPVQESKGMESSHNEVLQRENVPLADEINDHMVEVPGTDKINFGDYFLPGKARPDVAASVTNSFDEGKNKKSQVNKSRSTIDPDNLTSHPDKELSEVTGNGSEAAAVTEFGGVKSSKDAGRSAALGYDVEASASSTSSLNRPLNTKKAGKSRSSKDQFRVAIRKLSDNNNTIVGSEGKKSLLAVPGAIFKEDSSGSSKNAAESDHSYSSTRTPFKNFLDYSGSGSDANEDTTDDENLSGEIGRISNGISGLSGDMSMTLNNILRSSSRYKKAKQAAVESQLNDSESQPVDFVPDSQAHS